MNKERGSIFAPRQLSWLIVASGVVITGALVTMASASKDRKVSDLVHNTAELQRQNTELLSSILSCANGGGYSVQFDPYNSTRVSCKIEFEWVNGKYFEGAKARVSPRSR